MVLCPLALSKRHFTRQPGAIFRQISWQSQSSDSSHRSSFYPGGNPGSDFCRPRRIRAIFHYPPSKSSFQHPASTSTEPKVKLILKADVLGSLEAITAALPRSPSYFCWDWRYYRIGHSLATATQAQIAGFNVRVSSSTAKLHENEKSKSMSLKIIYELLDQVNLLANPKINEEIKGRAEIKAEFKIANQRIAGALVTQGEISKSDTIKIADITTQH